MIRGAVWTGWCLGVALGGGLLGCGQPEGWTDDAALRPELAQLDRDQDGVVRADELARRQWPERPFEDVDSDGDGALSLAELRQVAFTDDPVPQGSGLRVTRPGEDAVYFPEPYDERVLRDLLRFLTEEARAVDARWTLPSEEAIAAAAATAAASSVGATSSASTIPATRSPAGKPGPTAMRGTRVAPSNRLVRWLA